MNQIMEQIKVQIKEQIKEQIKVMATALPALGGYLKLDANNINILVNDLYNE